METVGDTLATMLAIIFLGLFIGVILWLINKVVGTFLYHYVTLTRILKDHVRLFYASEEVDSKTVQAIYDGCRYLWEECGVIGGIAAHRIASQCLKDIRKKSFNAR